MAAAAKSAAVATCTRYRTAPATGLQWSTGFAETVAPCSGVRSSGASVGGTAPAGAAPPPTANSDANSAATRNGRIRARTDIQTTSTHELRCAPLHALL